MMPAKLGDKTVSLADLRRSGVNSTLSCLRCDPKKKDLDQEDSDERMRTSSDDTAQKAHGEAAGRFLAQWHLCSQ